MDLVKVTDNTGRHIYTPHPSFEGADGFRPSKGIVGIAHASNSQLLTRQGRERKFRKVKGHFLHAIPFTTPSPLAATFPSSKKARPSFQSWNIGRDVARFITFRVKIEYRISMILRWQWIGGKGGRNEKEVSRENVCRPLELDNLRFSPVFIRSENNALWQSNSLFAFPSNFPLSIPPSFPSFLTSFHPVPLSFISTTGNKFTRASSFVPRIYVFWRESSLLDWAAVGYDPIHRFFFATHSRIYTCCSTNGAWL